MIGPLHISLHVSPIPRPLDAPRATVVTWSGRTLRPLDLSPTQLHAPFRRSFEQAAERLERLDRMFLEPDGSFVWTGADELGTPWQLDGVLYDRGGHLLYVELKGSCPDSAWRQLLEALADCDEPLVAQWILPGVIVPVEEL